MVENQKIHQNAIPYLMIEDMSDSASWQLESFIVLKRNEYGVSINGFYLKSTNTRTDNSSCRKSQ